MFDTQTANLEGWVGQPFAVPIKIKQNGVPYDLTGKPVTLVVEDTTARASLTTNIVPKEGEVEIVSAELRAGVTHCEWYLTIGNEGPIVRGNFEFKTL